MPPPELMEDVVEEVLLRFPPADPASLVRAALVCRLWRRLVSAAAFGRRFREFHRAAPLLGVLCRRQDDSDDDEDDAPPTALFVPASSFRPARAHHRGWLVVDARHGRVLLSRLREPSPPGPAPWTICLSVWDPVTDEQRHLPGLPSRGEWKAAVVCAAAAGGLGGCDHLDCHRGSFLVVALFMDFGHQRMFTCIYASEANAWSEPTSTNHPYIFCHFEPGPGFLLGNTIHFLVCRGSGILKYDMITQEVSTINLPSRFSDQKNVLMSTEDGSLGLATMNTMLITKANKLHLWFREVVRSNSNERDESRFVLTRTIDLERLLPASALKGSARVNGFADCGASRVLLMHTREGLYTGADPAPAHD